MARVRAAVEGLVPEPALWARERTRPAGAEWARVADVDRRHHHHNLRPLKFPPLRIFWRSVRRAKLSKSFPGQPAQSLSFETYRLRILSVS